jgi:flagellar biogenesis protein FliO
MLEKAIHEGYEFVKVGKAQWCEEGIVAKHEGKEQTWHAALSLVDERFLDAEQSVYMVKVDDEITYIGVYTDSFETRWLKAKRYFWHSVNVDDKITALIKQGREVTVWLTTNPYASIDDRSINVSQSIEYELIKAIKPEWNTTHKNKKKNNEFLKVLDIVNSLPEPA